MVFPSQANASIIVTVTRSGTTGNVTLNVNGLHATASVTVQSPGAANTGTVTIGAGTAPAGTYSTTVTNPSCGQFAAYSTQLVKYYNTGGLTDAGGTFHKSPSSSPITWWGIYNEPNYNDVPPTQYVQLYNATVPAMQAADPTLKFVAIELGDSPTYEQQYVPTFVQNVTAQVDVIATRSYSTCNQRDSDAHLFATIPEFATGVKYIRSQIATNPTLTGVPVWITENNGNADYQGANGMSMCNPTQQFVTDKRGSSAFFAAWRPLMFSQVGKAGAEALYHWDFAADAQYGELDDQTGNPCLSYWVDYWLAQMFPANPGANLLQFNSSDTTGLETLAVRNPDNSVVVMIANCGVASVVDNNGPGLPLPRLPYRCR